MSKSVFLAGKVVLVTRPEGQLSQFSSDLEALGATVLEMPALAIVPPSSWEPLDTAIAQIATYDWLVLTSANGVDYFFQRLRHHGKDPDTIATMNIAVVGKKTAQRLAQFNVQPTLIPTDFVADALVSELCQREAIAGKQVLFPRVESGGREILVQSLTAQGAIVSEVAAYQSGCPDQMAPTVWKALQTRAVDVVTFTSSKTVRCFWELLAAQGATLELLDKVAIASIGPQTSETCQAIFGRVDIEAVEFTLEGLTQAILQWSDPSF